MSSNRRRDGGAGFARACKAALMCTLLAAAGIGYVRQTMEQDRLGRLVTEQEARIAELNEESHRQKAIRSMLSSSDAIQERVRQFGLHLAPATLQQRIFITVPAVPPGSTNDSPASSGIATARRKEADSMIRSASRRAPMADSLATLAREVHPLVQPLLPAR